ncbi:hypothetical protein DN069_30910 [Streptacidiphilus pinicola]|uniref:DegT/DnrJ/EryC1/StrS aminotransferase family protein n=1 Tax=Streptacidiphilus pinicola TaxID=2219663 RepID=A0A2X0IEF3_9ACTN|nr:DegT/DnrJ/EryC1/StrS family aminotransferase [Streptacidiphilus pinicola]RAG81811.1 hypothetical protein DN069_30910 [Streptacidiphilus pinicola]
MPAYADPAEATTPPKALQDWLGYDRMLLLDSGSAALSLILDALTASCPEGGRGSAVGVPGLGCWTLTSAVEAVGARPVFYDVDRRGEPIEPAGGSPSVLIQPWGGTVGAHHFAPELRAAFAPRVLDCTLSIFGAPAASRATDGFTAAVISLGQAKPLGLPGGGGLLLVDDGDLFDELRGILRHHYENLTWTRRARRYTSSDRLASALELQVSWLKEQHGSKVEEAQRLREHVASATALEPLAPPRAVDTPGITVVVPFLLPADYPVSARDLHRVAMAERIPLITHPVTPPYLEPAGADLSGDCPVAEDMARRLVFLPSSLAELGSLDALSRLLDSAAAQAPAFRYPYVVPGAAKQEAPADLRGPGIIGRQLNGGFVFAHQPSRRRYRVSAAVATDLMERLG